MAIPTSQTPSAKSRPLPLPRNVVKQPWGYEYTCCGGEWGLGHIGRCGS
jgi:hypothetical protein